MRLSDKELYLLQQCAISAAFQAGQVIMQYYKKQLAVEKKSQAGSLATQVVTEVDEWAQAIILKILKPTCDQFDLAMLSEESPDDQQRLLKDFFWCVDPLDGTLSFVESKPGFAVSIALVSRQGEAISGVIYDPLEQNLYHAVKGQGAFKNDTAMQLHHSVPAQDLTLMMDRSFQQHPDFSLMKADFEARVLQADYRRIIPKYFGGAAMNAIWVLEHQPACFFKLPKTGIGGGCLWDYAASACIFNEVGAVVSDMSGNSLELNRKSSCYLNHQGVLYCTDVNLANSLVQLYQSVVC